MRRCRIANSSYNDQQIEEMLEEGKTDVFNDCILSQVTNKTTVERQNPNVRISADAEIRKFPGSVFRQSKTERFRSDLGH